MANEYRATGLPVEVVLSYSSAARLHGLEAEVVGAFPSNARISGLTVEVVRSISSASAGSRRQIMLGSC